MMDNVLSASPPIKDADLDDAIRMKHVRSRFAAIVLEALGLDDSNTSHADASIHVDPHFGETRLLLLDVESNIEDGVATLETMVEAVRHALNNKLGLRLLETDTRLLQDDVIAPLFEALRLTKAMNATFEVKMFSAGTEFSRMFMIFPPQELEWDVYGDDEELLHAPPQLVKSDREVVVFTVFPGIPHAFGMAETVVHLAEVVTICLPMVVIPPPPKPLKITVWRSIKKKLPAVSATLSALASAATVLLATVPWEQDPDVNPIVAVVVAVGAGVSVRGAIWYWLACQCHVGSTSMPSPRITHGAISVDMGNN
ncbi:hypothetical protein AMAG_12863 [Allomyces macrogynus ATCC 38327]|uniref:Uncharacterized protein n=1 Tax=Allomyces macrogynus (strain ATCC 38327) TaxID=578462 RepID=A0A0L0T0S4_ALLM3|nr:hypothetical protein AMAG_12863 [Allomyces macrogynus ATCC 38327]|eukprot:KNE68179.1 hypothetical protein AMAG_12863 [Allomyces macrogynus ATCC 38327]